MGAKSGGKLEKPKTGYELANDVIKAGGYADPEALSDGERFDIVLRHVLRVGKRVAERSGNDKARNR